MGKYITEQRKILLSLFQDHMHKTFSSSQIYELIKDKHNISLSTIYRNLSSMEKDGLLTRNSEQNSRDAFFKYVDPHHCANIIHLSCIKCHEQMHTDIKDSQLLAKTIDEKYHFSLDRKATILYGLCGKCSQIESRK